MTGTCTDNAGNSSSSTNGDVNIDSVNPTITFHSQVPVANANGWNNTDVTVNWDCGDALSGPVNASVSDVRSAEGTADASGTCVDLAGNSASATRQVKIDKTDPVVTCPAVPTFLQSQLPQTITATVSDALSLAASPTASGTANNPSGGTVSITGMDRAGNSKTVQCAYHVGNTTFLAPVDKAPTMNIAKLGRVVPVKVNLVYDGAAVTTTGTVYVGGLTNVNCSTGTAGDDIEVYAAGASNTGNLFRWDSTGPFWIYNFDTSAFKMNAGNCYRINVYYGGTVSNGNASGGTLVGYFLMQTTK
jgi:large repetitive protein